MKQLGTGDAVKDLVASVGIDVCVLLQRVQVRQRKLFRFQNGLECGGI